MTAPRSVDDATYFIRGITFKPRDLVDPGDADAVVCMRTKNVQKDLDETDLIAVPKRLVRKPELYLQPGDTLISSANSWKLVGKCSYVGTLSYPATAGGFISIVRPKSNTHPRFLFHWLNSPRVRHVVRNLGRQTTNISNLDVPRFKKLDFPEIDYEEQRRIARILDKADAIRRKRGQALALADGLLKSVFLEMFGDPDSNPNGLTQLSLSTRARFVSGATPRKSNPEFWNGQFPWITPKDMKTDTIHSSRNHVSELALEQVNLKKIPAGTPLMVVRGMILAHTLPLAVTACEVTINQDIKAIEFNDDIDPIFGFWCLKVQQGKILGRVSTAAHGTKRLDMDSLGTVPILLPDKDAQRDFISIARKFATLRTNIAMSTELASSTLSSLSQRAFAGDL